MKERPILSSGPMVQAIRDGRKTQTRRTSGLENANAMPGLYDRQPPNAKLTGEAGKEV